MLLDLRDYLPATIELAMASLVVSLLVGIPLGMWAAINRNQWNDGFARVLALLGGSLPVFYVGLLLLGLFYRRGQSH